MTKNSLNSFLKKTMFRKRLQKLESKKKLYIYTQDKDEIYNFQLNGLNSVWHSAVRDMPFYKRWKQIYNLPDNIRSIEDLKRFPPLTKKDICLNEGFILSHLKNYYLTATGGTSGITTNFPTSKLDAEDSYANAYTGRSWWGIRPFDKILMFWGHSHLFGTGMMRYVKSAKRKLADFLISTKRVSCYSLGVGNVESFYSRILKERPHAIISYTSNVYRMCKFMEANGLSFRDENLKAVILTSETATDADVKLIKERLNTNVVHEYGMAETGAVAYSCRTTDNIRILWDSFVITTDAKGRLFITTTGNKIFPLINYDSEDLVDPGDVYKNSVLGLSHIKGKERDVLKLPSVNGEILSISTIFFDHILKCYPGIYSIHYKQTEDGASIVLTSDTKLDFRHLKRYFAQEASREFRNIDFEKIHFTQSGEIPKTVAGKNKTFIKEANIL